MDVNCWLQDIIGEAQEQKVLILLSKAHIYFLTTEIVHVGIQTSGVTAGICKNESLISISLRSRQYLIKISLVSRQCLMGMSLVYYWYLISILLVSS